MKTSDGIFGTAYDICVEGSRRTVGGEIVGNFGLRKPDPENWWDVGPDIVPTRCPHAMWEVTHLPTGARVGMFRDRATALDTIAEFEAIENVAVGTFGVGHSTAPGVFEAMAKIFNDAAKVHGDAVRY